MINDEPPQRNLNKVRKNLMKNFPFKNLIEMNLPLKDFVNEFEKQIIEEVLFLTRGNQKKAAYLLGVKPTTFCEKMKKYKILLRNFRE
jgi:DNA-binding NtrC family response regulator